MHFHQASFIVRILWLRIQKIACGQARCVMHHAMAFGFLGLAATWRRAHFMQALQWHTGLCGFFGMIQPFTTLTGIPARLHRLTVSHVPLEPGMTKARHVSGCVSTIS